MKAFIIENEGGLEIQLPATIIVCPRCRGTGVHDPAGFSQGFSSDDFAEDPDFAEAYFRGRYDVQCEKCHGRNVVTIPDEDRMTDEQKTLWFKHCDDEASYRAEVEAERRMGA